MVLTEMQAQLMEAGVLELAQDLAIVLLLDLLELRV